MDNNKNNIDFDWYQLSLLSNSSSNNNKNNNTSNISQI
jgi:hypothetical protein